MANYRWVGFVAMVGGMGCGGGGGGGGEISLPPPAPESGPPMVVFESWATNLVGNDTNGLGDIFLHDPGPGGTSRVSTGMQGQEANDSSREVSISRDRRYVAFTSDASNLVAVDGIGVTDVFRFDRRTGQTTRVSATRDGSSPNGPSYSPSISGDGMRVAFTSLASNLVEGDRNETNDVFLYDFAASAVSRVSVSTHGAEGDGSSMWPSLSANGRHVAFQSRATTLVTGDTNAAIDVFVRDLETGVTERASVATDGTEGNGMSLRGSISADGRYVVFPSVATNLAQGKVTPLTDIFLRDRESRRTYPISINSMGQYGGGSSDSPSISDDGRFVAYHSYADNLVLGDSNHRADIFLLDRQSGNTERIAVGSDGVETNEDSFAPRLSGNGRWIAFASRASNLVSGDSNHWQDVFLHDREAARTIRASVRSDGTQGDGISGGTSESLGGFAIAISD